MTFSKYPTYNTVPLTPISFLKRTASIFPHYPAITYEEKTRTWHDVHENCENIARALIKKGLQKNDVVSVLLPNVPEMIELHFAILMAGGIINTINYRLDIDTIEYILDHGEAKFCFIDTGFLPLINHFDKSALTQKICFINVDDASVPAHEKKLMDTCSYHELLTLGKKETYPLPCCDDESDTSALNYTSGTSGRPKGVLYHHRGAYLMTLGTVSAWQLTMHPTYLYTVPMFHCNGWGHVYTMTLQAGHFICLRQIDPSLICHHIKKYQITHFGAAPVVLGMLVHDKDINKTLPLHLVQVMTAGAPPAPSVIEKCEKLGFNIMQVYGLTETYGHVIQSLWQKEWDDFEHNVKAQYKARQGVALPMTEDVQVINIETEKPVAKNGEEMGEIRIRGNTIMKGYYKDENATRNAFKDGYFCSGDLAVMYENGYIEIKDRLKDIIISGGENISSVEIEAILYRIEGVQGAAVIPQKDEKWGEVPIAIIETAHHDHHLTQEDVIAYCRKNLAGFKIPKKVYFQELPKTATGKIQKFKLKKQFL